MKRIPVLVSLLMALLVSADPAYAKCISILVRVQGEVAGQIQEGDELLLQFIYSPKRAETSPPHLVKTGTFTLTGAYSTFKRRGVFHADVCGATPRQIQLVMRDRSGTVLDVVVLKTPDGQTGEADELAFGKKQSIVLHRTLTHS